jgi:hypothetical protein
VGLGRVVLLPTMWKRQKKSGAKSPPRQGNGGQALTPLWELGNARRVSLKSWWLAEAKIPAVLARMIANVPDPAF